MPLTQAQLVTAVADRADMSKAEAKRAVEALEEIVLEQLGNAEKVRIGGIVQLTVRVKPATKKRTGRNPATGEEITIGAKPASVDVRARPLAKAKGSPSVRAEGAPSTGCLAPAPDSRRAARGRYVSGGGVPSALAASAGSHSHVAQACRNTSRANSSASARESGAARTSSQSRTYSPRAASHRPADCSAPVKASRAGCA